MAEYFEAFIRVEDISAHFASTESEEKTDLILLVGQLQLLYSLVPEGSSLSPSSQVTNIFSKYAEKRLIYLSIKSKCAISQGKIDMIRLRYGLPKFLFFLPTVLFVLRLSSLILSSILSIVRRTNCERFFVFSQTYVML
jgi:hypothetical protein